MTAAAQQQQASRARVPSIVVPSVPLFWTPLQIKDATGSIYTPVEDIAFAWPLIAAAMQAYGIWDRENAAGMAGTVAIETAHSFKPVMESYYLFGSAADYDQAATDAYNKKHLRYYPWYGKGLIQTTWESEYQRLQNETGIPVHDNPNLALDMRYAPTFAASYWADRNIAPYARARDWTTVRARVQGGESGLDELITSAETLLKLSV